MQHSGADLNYGAMNNEVITGLGAQISHCLSVTRHSLSMEETTAGHENVLLSKSRVQCCK